MQLIFFLLCDIMKLSRRNAVIWLTNIIWVKFKSRTGKNLGSTLLFYGNTILKERMQYEI